MKKNNIFVFVLVALLIVSFFFSFSFEKPPRNCEDETEDNKVMCYADEAGRTGEYNLCEQFVEVDRAICYTAIGIDEKDPSLCENLETEYDINFCYQNILEEAYIGMKDCEKLEEPHETKCIAYLSLYTLASGECEKVERENSRNLCFKLIAELLDETGLCDKVDEAHVGLCDDYLE